MHYLDAAGSEGAFLGSAAAVTARVVEVLYAGAQEKY